MHKFRNNSFAHPQSGPAKKSLFRHTIVGNVAHFFPIGWRFRAEQADGTGLIAPEGAPAGTPSSQAGNIAQLPRCGLEKRLHAGP
jgi:hypothetical protein